VYTSNQDSSGTYLIHTVAGRLAEMDGGAEERDRISRPTGTGTDAHQGSCQKVITGEAGVGYSLCGMMDLSGAVAAPVVLTAQ
jgi:hypothetical protein